MFIKSSLCIAYHNKTTDLSYGFYFYSTNTRRSQLKNYFASPLHRSPLSAEKAVNMHAKATGGHGIGSPCKPPSRVQRVRSAIRDDDTAAVGTGMCRLRRSVRPVGRDEGTREAGGLPGEKTFGDFGSFQSHSPQPEGRAKPCRGQRPRVLHGEAMPIRREGTCLPSGRPQKKPQPRAAVFLLAQPVGTRHQQGHRP